MRRPGSSTEQKESSPLPTGSHSGACWPEPPSFLDAPPTAGLWDTLAQPVFVPQKDRVGEISRYTLDATVAR